MSLSRSFRSLRLLKHANATAQHQQLLRSLPRGCIRRCFQTAAGSQLPVPDFAFAFDIDGVLLRASKPIPGAPESLAFLERNKIPFILITNGGGKHEIERVEELNKRLSVSLEPSMFVQSHTPFAELVRAKDSLENKTVLVVGGEGDNCRRVAERYGFKTVVTPGDIFMADPSVSPHTQVFMDYYKGITRPLPKPINPSDPSNSLKIDAMFVYNDPRDWGLDLQIIMDLLLSSQGIVGTLSDKNGRTDLPNRGFQQDGQPPIYFSNPDLWWAAAYHLPRLGQGGFREALEGAWSATTGGAAKGVELKKTLIGKPCRATYAFAERRLMQHRAKLLGRDDLQPLKKVYMVGDNPESDIRGANSYQSEAGSDWQSVLVRTGVYDGGVPAWKPHSIADDVKNAVRWGLENSKWPVTLQR